MINYQWVKSFMVLVQEQHFTRAANRLNITQPGLSQHIQKLEQQIGKPLIVRVGKKFELTHEGLSLLKYGSRIQKQEQEFLSSITLDDPFKGPINIACSGTLAMLLYPALLKRQRKNKGLSIHVEAAPNARIIELILENECELGLVTHLSYHKRLNEQKIGVQQLALIIPSSFKQRCGAAPSFLQLKQLGFINHPDGHHYAERVLGDYYPNDFKCISEFPETGYINQIQQILHPVAQGLGFTVLPHSTVRDFIHPQRLSVVQFSEPVQEIIYLVKKKNKTLPSRYNWLLNTIKSQLKLA